MTRTALDHQDIDHLQEGALVHQFFLLRQVEERTDKTGKPYLSLVLGDKSGTIVARVWNKTLVKCPGPFAPGDYVGVQGQVDAYKGELQLTVNYINTVQALEAMGKDLKDFDPELLHLATPFDRHQLWQDLRQLAATHIQPPLSQLVLRLLDRYQELLLVCPAARLYHHPYLGGLLEHTCFVARHAQASLAVYPDLNPSLALAGAILHDLGKVKEIANPTAPELTIPGQLLGHIVLGWEMVREEARAMEFPDANLLIQLEHIIMAHHGALEFGSPVPPKTREAMLVYCLDDLDAKLKMMSTHLQSHSGDGDFTSYHRVLQRGLYKGGKTAAPEKNSEK
jgi:3'-5' exoribonuclease